LSFSSVAGIKALKIRTSARLKNTGQITGVKTMPRSLPYHPFKIQNLKYPKYSAGYITAILEEKDPEPDLLEAALKDVFEALGELSLSEEEAKQHLEKLDELLSKKGSDAIYSLGEWLNALGLKLTVTVCEEEQESPAEAAETSEVTVG
jgi:DNA-binding phage protein